MKTPLDETDRRVVNRLQDGIAVCERPFARPAAELGLVENELLARLERLLAEGALSRFGPMYNSEKFGGAVTLCALEVPPERFEEVAAIVNEFPEVAHNYERDHRLNMWFVLATETQERLHVTIDEIERLTGLKVLNLPKQEEYFIGMRVEA